MQKQEFGWKANKKIKRKEIYMAEVLPNKYKGIIITHDIL
jgi:hypothetical protein